MSGWTLRGTAACAALCLAVAASTTAQDLSQQRTLRVRVIDGTTLEPVADVAVIVRCRDSYPSFTRWVYNQSPRTDARGYVVVQLNEYAVCSVLGGAKAGYLPETDNRPIEMVGGEFTRVARVWKMGFVEGRVLERSGNPVANTPVRLLAHRPERSAEWAATGTEILTDARGVFVFGPIGAGKYSVALPALTLVEAAPSIDLRPGASLTGFDVRADRVAVFRVSGRIVDGAGQQVVTEVFLDKGDSPVNEPMTLAETRATGGSFSFSQVPAGEYRVRVDTWARTRAAPVAPLWASEPLTIDRDVESVSVVARPLADVRGSVVFEGAAAPPEGPVLVNVWAAGGADSRGIGGALSEPVVNGRFSVRGLRPGRYIVGMSAYPRGWQLDRVMLDTHDVSVEPFELGTTSVDNITVTLVRKSTTISGVVRDAAGKTDGDATVLLFPPESDRWSNAGPTPRRVRHVLTDQNGRYTVMDFPPGEYLIAAVPTETGVWPRTSDLDLIRRAAPAATRIRVGYDVPGVLDLRTAR